MDWKSRLFIPSGMKEYELFQCGELKMKKEKHIVHYTAEELDAAITPRESQTDWEKVRQMTDEEIERNADEDPESLLYPLGKSASDDR